MPNAGRKLLQFLKMSLCFENLSHAMCALIFNAWHFGNYPNSLLTSSFVKKRCVFILRQLRSPDSSAQTDPQLCGEKLQIITSTLGYC